MDFGLSRAEAEIAAVGDSRNPANGKGSRNDLGEVFEPVGRGGYRDVLKTKRR
jgi:hypothetical protein